MYVAVWSVIFQVVLEIVKCIVIGVGHDENLAPTERATVELTYKKATGVPRTIGLVCAILYSLAQFAMYCSAVIVMMAVWRMTPETIPPYNDAGNLLPGMKVPAPPQPS